MQVSRSGKTIKQPLPRQIWILIAACFAVAIGFGLIAPVLPQFARSFDVGFFRASLVISAFAVFRLLFAPFAGWCVDRFGERPTFIAGVLIVSLSTGACAFAHTFNQLLAFRAVGGIGSTMFTVSTMGFIVRLAPPTARGRVSSLYSGSFTIGAIGGPLVGGVLAKISMATPFLVYSVALLVSAFLVWRFIPKTETAHADKVAAPKVYTMSEALSDSAYRANLMTGFSNGWTNFGVRNALVPLFAMAALGAEELTSALGLSAFAVGLALALSKSGGFTDKVGRRVPLMIGLTLAGASTLAFGFAPSVVVFFALSLIGGIATGIFTAPLQATLSDVIGQERSGGRPLAVSQMSSDLGAIIGSLVGGLLADRVGFGWAFAVGGGLMLLSAVVWGIARETHPVKRSGGPAPAA